MIRQLWREKVEYVPAALEHLSRRDAVVEFVSRLSDVEVRELVQRVVHVFGVTRITRIEATDFPCLVVAPRVEHVAQVSSEMPWRHVAPESDTPRLRPLQRLFVGIALMIQRAPARVRTVSFAREVERWVQEQVVSAETVSESETISEEQSETEIETATPALSETSDWISVNPISARFEELTTARPHQRSASSAVKEPEVKIANAVFRYEQPEAVPSAVLDEVLNDQLLVATEPVSAITPAETLVSRSVPLDEITIETELGGLFYLINLAIFLEIYSDFTSPVEKSHEDLSIWDFVAMVGREINQDHDLDDPIWTGLQDLQDGHDSANLVNPENPVHKPTWLSDLLPHIKARLILALGIESEDFLATILLHHHARVTITPTHLDVFFSLSDHPIEIRLSGLDRNPGWVPAAGRFIAFHYD